MNPERLKRITIEAGKCGGRPCIRGLRIRVSDVLELLGAGASFEETLEDYPYLEREDIFAAIEFERRRAELATELKVADDSIERGDGITLGSPDDVAAFFERVKKQARAEHLS